MQKALNYIIDDTFDRLVHQYPNSKTSLNNFRKNTFNELHKDLLLETLWTFKELIEY